MGWPIDPRPAKCIVKLRAQIDALFPGRDIDSDGMLGNAAHAAGVSDHNPYEGIVHAIDITHDPQHGFDSERFANMLLVKKDKRIRYVISNRKIASGTDQDHTAWVWRPYNGDNPHDHHCHVSIKSPKTGDNDRNTLADDASDWDIDVTMIRPTVPVGKPTLRQGSKGPDVKLLQQLLKMPIVDSDFGGLTKTAVIDFQKANGLGADGIVGPQTWKILLALDQSQPEPTPQPEPAPQPAPPTPASGIDINEIAATAQSSNLAKYDWSGRGRTPIGYTKGMAVMYAVCAKKLAERDPVVVDMVQPLGDASHDALAHYVKELRAKGFKMNNGSEIERLRALFTLMTGLGPRESGGDYTEGRDTTAEIPASADTAEAGLFQMSYDLHPASPLIDKLLDEYQGRDGYRAIFAEGIPRGISPNFGSGRGALFQKTCKEKPAFSVLVCGIGLRHRRTHWGPINRKEVEISRTADELFKQVTPS